MSEIVTSQDWIQKVSSFFLALVSVIHQEKEEETTKKKKREVTCLNSLSMKTNTYIHSHDHVQSYSPHIHLYCVYICTWVSNCIENGFKQVIIFQVLDSAKVMKPYEICVLNYWSNLWMWLTPTVIEFLFTDMIYVKKKIVFGITK